MFYITCEQHNNPIVLQYHEHALNADD